MNTISNSVHIPSYKKLDKDLINKPQQSYLTQTKPDTFEGTTPQKEEKRFFNK